MSDRYWFYASRGQQLGPYPEAQFREFFTTGTATADTLVWTDGMAGWLKAGDIPGLLSNASGPSAVPNLGTSWPAHGAASGQPLSSDFSIWALLGRLLVYIIGLIVVIPAPWAATSLYRWFIEHLRVPQRPNLRFTGKASDIWYVFVMMGLGLYLLTLACWLIIPIPWVLGWYARWKVSQFALVERTA